MGHAYKSAPCAARLQVVVGCDLLRADGSQQDAEVMFAVGEAAIHGGDRSDAYECGFDSGLLRLDTPDRAAVLLSLDEDRAWKDSVGACATERADADVARRLAEQDAQVEQERFSALAAQAAQVRHS